MFLNACILAAKLTGLFTANDKALTR